MKKERKRLCGRVVDGRNGEKENLVDFLGISLSYSALLLQCKRKGKVKCTGSLALLALPFIVALSKPKALLPV